MAWEARLDGAVYGQSESVAGAVLRAGWRPNVPLLHPSAAPEQRDGMTAPAGEPG